MSENKASSAVTIFGVVVMSIVCFSAGMTIKMETQTHKWQQIVDSCGETLDRCQNNTDRCQELVNGYHNTLGSCMSKLEEPTTFYYEWRTP